jgi:hypothetical protein
MGGRKSCHLEVPQMETYWPYLVIAGVLFALAMAIPNDVIVAYEEWVLDHHGKTSISFGIALLVTAPAVYSQLVETTGGVIPIITNVVGFGLLFVIAVDVFRFARNRKKR